MRLDERLFLNMGKESCGECGAELRLGPAACPLCGADAVVPPAAPLEVEDYHDRVRRLRDELIKLRKEDLRAS
ncbi:MAG: hypothetical protein M3345_00255 [Actinomycetota bacterium]|nr:hypothetical protein [Actinomycetota bacterium]